MRRPARVATISKVWTPCPVSTIASTRSPFTKPTILRTCPLAARNAHTISGSCGDRGSTPSAPYCTAKVAVAVTDPPRAHVTAAFAVPGFVVDPTFHVQDTISYTHLRAHETR